MSSATSRLREYMLSKYDAEQVCDIGPNELLFQSPHQQFVCLWEKGSWKIFSFTEVFK